MKTEEDVKQQKKDKTKKKKKRRKQQLNSLKAEEKLAEDVRQAIAKFALLNVEELIACLGDVPFPITAPEKLPEKLPDKHVEMVIDHSNTLSEGESEEDMREKAELAGILERYRNKENVYYSYNKNRSPS